MKIVLFKRVCILLVVCLIIGAGVVMAEPRSIPGGPNLQPNQNISWSRWLTFDDVEEQLMRLERQSKGRLEVEVAGRTTTGMPIYLAKFGEPCENKPRILIQSQIHGDETPHTISIMELIKTLATSGNKDVQNILDKVTIWFVPMLNPEGCMYINPDGEHAPSRRNNQPWDPEEWGLDPSTPAPWYHRPITHPTGYLGYDINRDFHPDLSFRLDSVADTIGTYIRSNALRYPDHSRCTCNERPNWHGGPGFFVTPEARTMAKIFEELKPTLVKDMHQMETNRVIEGTNDMITLFITGQAVCCEGYTDPVTGIHYPLDEEVLKLSKQVNALVYEKLNERGNSHYGNIALFQDLRTIGMNFATYQLNGAAIMLYEFRGFSTYFLGQKGSGNDIKAAYDAMYSTLLGFATGDVYDVDPAIYDTIPYWGERFTPRSHEAQSR